MANDDSMLREVDQELAEERQWADFRRYGPIIIGGAIAVVMGVAGLQIWNSVQTRTAETQALEYRNAMDILAEDQIAGRTALEAVAAEKGGYGALAALQRAGSYAAGGERLRALETYREIADGRAPKRVRELAQLRAAYLALADGRDAVIADLGNLTEDEGPFGYHAKEIMALASLGAEDYETALSSFNLLATDLAAPQGVRDRADEFAALAAAAKAGVNITGEAQLQDLLDVVGGGDPTNDTTPDTTLDGSIDEGAPTSVVDDSTGVEEDHEDQEGPENHDGHNNEE